MQQDPYFKKPTVKRLNELKMALKFTYWLPEEIKFYISLWTKGRSDYYRQLYAGEVDILIDVLMDLFKQVPAAKRRLSYIVNLCISHEFIYGDTGEDFDMNRAKIDLYILQNGKIKKPLLEQNAKELAQTTKLFETLFSGKAPKVSVIQYYAKLGLRDYSAFGSFSS